jgi:hypothetical protein
MWPFTVGHRERTGVFTSVPKTLTLAVTCRAFTVLQSQIEYVTVPPGEVREEPRSNSPVTQITPGFGVGLCDGDFVGFGDFDGLGDFVGLLDGLGLLDGVVVFEGLGLWLGLELFVGLGVGVGVLVGFDPVGVALGVLDGCELAVCVTVGRGLMEGTFRPDELGLGPVSGIWLAFTACADAVPHTALSNGPLGAPRAGATAGPDTRNRPAPAATAACPTRTILTGTAALR